MALKEPYMMRTFTGASPYTITAPTGCSILVKDVHIYSPTDDWVTFRIEKTTVGFFRVSEAYGNHLVYRRPYRKAKTVLSFLSDLGIFKGYPVAEGETFTITGLGSASSRATVIYEVYDPGDVKPDDPNGSKSKEYFFINYGDTGDVIDASGDFLISSPLNPIEFPAFPFGVDVPAKTKITIHGILGKEVAVWNSTPARAIYTTYLRFVRERVVLFDENRNGIVFSATESEADEGIYAGRGYSDVGNFDHLDERLPLIFPEPLTFESGEELNIYLSVVEAVDGSEISRDYQVIGLIETVTRE